MVRFVFAYTVYELFLAKKKERKKKKENKQVELFKFFSLFSTVLKVNGTF